MAAQTILYSFWASSCSWRVRMALYIKNIPFVEKNIDIAKGRQQLTPEFRAINPAQKVPALVIEIGKAVVSDPGETLQSRAELYHLVATMVVTYITNRSPFMTLAEQQCFKGAWTNTDGTTLVESMAILQYLEDTRPEKSLTPSSPLLKARMRQVVETVVSGIQPLQNIGLKSHFSTNEQYVNFTKYWTDRGLQTLEELLEKSAGRYCVGEELSLADLCLVPQVYNAVSRHKLDISKFPTVSRLYETLLKEETFRQTHPEVVRSKL